MKDKTAYEHGSRRRNNPTAEMATTSHPERRAPARHRVDIREKDRNRVPTLDWNRKHETKTVLAPLLGTVEKIDPATWIESLRRKDGERDLFASFDRYEHPERAKWEWYEHSGNWQNRLIHGTSKRVMASLLEHEQMAGEVQCVYFDPPYGMDFDAHYMDDTVQVTAFRDSYENGIHTYLDGIRDTALLARELLSDTGSFFMQIGDVNVHRCAMVLDEVFGPENRVSTITYATGGGGSSTKSIAKAGDFILWYAKDVKAPMQFQTLYEEQDIESWCDTQTFAGGALSANIAETPTTHGMRGRQRGTMMKADPNVGRGVYPLATPALGGAPPRAETPPTRRAPDPEVLAKPTRRRFSAEYRLRMVEEADRGREPGEIGRLLRREGRYRSHLSTWRKARRRGALQGLTPRKRGPKPAPSHPLGAQVRRLEAQVARREKERATAPTILEVQGNVAGLLGFRLRDGKDCGWPPLPSLGRSASRRPVGRWGCPGPRSTAAGGPFPGISSPVRRPPGP